MLAGSFRLYDKGVSKCRYVNSLLNETAFKIATSAGRIYRTTKRLAASPSKEFVSSGHYAQSSRSRLEVKDDSGGVLLSIPIRQFGFEAI